MPRRQRLHADHGPGHAWGRVQTHHWGNGLCTGRDRYNRIAGHAVPYPCSLRDSAVDATVDSLGGESKSASG